MNETLKPKSGWRTPGALKIWLIFFAIVGAMLASADWIQYKDGKLPPFLFQGFVCVAIATGATGLWLAVRWLNCWRNVRRALIGLAIFATLVAIFYTEENWRGKRAWENCKRELEAKGAELDWNKLIPPPLPDDQNFFKAPKMAEWFGKNRQSLTNELTERLRNADTTATNLNEAAAAKYLAWSEQFESDFDLIREALKRPYARMDGDYSRPFEIPIPNFISVRIVSQTLAQRAKCDLLLGHPDKALQEVTLIHDMCRLLEGAPTGKPMTLVAAMINVAVTGLYVDVIAKGLQSHAWQEPQLVALQAQLKEINLQPFVVEAFKFEQAAGCHMAEIVDFSKIFNFNRPEKISLWRKIFKLRAYGYDFMPRGWVYQNMVVHARLMQKPINSFDPAGEIISPHKMDSAMSEITTALNHYSPYKLLASVATPKFYKGISNTRAQSNFRE